MKLEDLNKLNFKEIGNWPMLAKLAGVLVLIVGLIAAGWWFDWSEQWSALDTAKQKEINLRDTFIEKKKQAINLDTYQQQLKDIEQSFGALLKQLPNKSEMEALLTDINQAGIGRGLEFELFKPAAQETFTEFYAELPITIKVSGGYHDFGAFSSDVSLLPRIVTLNDISITSEKDGRLTMDCIAKTYRYLDDAELAAQRKATSKGAKK